MLRDRETQSLFDGYHFENREDQRDKRATSFGNYA